MYDRNERPSERPSGGVISDAEAVLSETKAILPKASRLLDRLESAIAKLEKTWLGKLLGF